VIINMNKDEIQLILEEGESYRIEFKESMTNIDKELVAFANSSGGRIFLGITDDKEIKGVNITNKFKSQIQDIANNCQPPIKIILEEFENILITNVRESEDKPYKCSSGFYIRVGPNSQKLSRNEIIEFCKAEGKIRFDELINLKFDYNIHFDPKKLEYFLKLAGISKVLDAPTVLTNLGVAERQEGKVIFNNTGILFFSKNLQDIYFHTAITCALYKGTEKVDVLDRRDFNEDLISSIDRTMNFLKQYIPLRYEMTGEPRRKEIPEIPYEALREAIINAAAHRDYFVTFKRPKIKETIVIPEIFNLKFDEMLRDEGVNDGVNEGVKVRLRKEIAYLNIHKYIIRTEVEKIFNISTATAERDLIILKKLGLIIFKGAPKTGKYILTDKGKEIISNIAN
jgi:ATP-dependent DNA helicase RecG